MAAITYMFDYTGAFTQNLVASEVHNLTEGNFRDFYYVIPKYSPFFTNNFSVLYKNDAGEIRALMLDVDYYMALPFYGATRSIGIPVFGAIAFNSALKTGSVSLTYQTVGGVWICNPDDVYTRLASIAYNPRIVTYEQVSGVPSIFPPINHDQGLTSILGQDALIAAIESIANVISNKVVDYSGNLDIIKQEIINYVDDKTFQCGGSLIMAGGLLGKNISVANTNVLIAQINNNVDYVLATLNMVNTGTVDANISIAISASTVISQSDYILYNLPLKANNSVIRTCLILNPSEYVYLNANTSDVVGRLYGIEQNGIGSGGTPIVNTTATWSPSTCPQGTSHVLNISNAAPNATVTISYNQINSAGTVIDTGAITTIGITDSNGNFTYSSMCNWVTGAVSGLIKTYVNGTIIDTSSLYTGQVTTNLSVSWSPSTCPQGTTHTLTVVGATPNASVAVSYSQLNASSIVVNTVPVTSVGTTDSNGNFTYSAVCDWVNGAVSSTIKTYVSGSLVSTDTVTNTASSGGSTGGGSTGGGSTGGGSTGGGSTGGGTPTPAPTTYYNFTSSAYKLTQGVPISIASYSPSKTGNTVSAQLSWYYPGGAIIKSDPIVTLGVVDSTGNIPSNSIPVNGPNGATIAKLFFFANGAAITSINQDVSGISLSSLALEPTYGFELPGVTVSPTNVNQGDQVTYSLRNLQPGVQISYQISYNFNNTDQANTFVNDGGLSGVIGVSDSNGNLTITSGWPAWPLNTNAAYAIAYVTNMGIMPGRVAFATLYKGLTSNGPTFAVNPLSITSPGQSVNFSVSAAAPNSVVAYTFNVYNGSNVLISSETANIGNTDAAGNFSLSHTVNYAAGSSRAAVSVTVGGVTVPPSPINITLGTTGQTGAATVSVTPSSVADGGYITTQVFGVAANAAMTYDIFYFSNDSSVSSTVQRAIPSGNADSNGNFTLSSMIRWATGIYLIQITPYANGALINPTAVNFPVYKSTTVSAATPTASITPSSVADGQTLTATITGVPAGATIATNSNIYNAGTLVGTENNKVAGTASASGTFNYSFPYTWVTNTDKLSIVVTANNVAINSQPIIITKIVPAVTYSPSASYSPSSLSASGQTISFSTSGGLPNSSVTVDIVFKDSSNNIVSVGTMYGHNFGTTDGNGYFALTTPIQYAPPQAKLELTVYVGGQRITNAPLVIYLY